MDVFQKNFVQDLRSPVNVRHCGGIMFTGDALADTITVTLYNGDQPAALTGTVVCKVIRADGATVAFNGERSGNVVSATLNASCFAVAGPISVILQVVDGGVKMSVLKAVYTVDAGTTETIVDPGEIIPDVTNLIEQIQAAVGSIPPEYSALLNTIAPDFSTSTAYTAGEYAWYSGTLYRFTADHPAGAWIGTDATAAVIGDDIAEFKAQIYNALTALEKGLTVTHQENVVLGTTHNYLFNDIVIPEGSELTITNNSTSGAFSINALAFDGSYQSLGSSISAGNSSTVIAPFDMYGLRSYINGTDWNFTIRFGTDITGKIKDINDKIEDLKNDLYGVIYTHSQSATVGTTLTYNFPDYIPSGTAFTITNAGTSTFTINGIKSDETYESLGTSISSGEARTITAEFDVYGLRSYINGTDWNFRVSYGGQIVDRLEKIEELSPLIDTQDFFFCRNLIGDTNGEYYPVRLHPNDTVTVSQNDGENFGVACYLRTYDINKNIVNSWSLNPNTTKRTIGDISLDASGNQHEIYYLMPYNVPSGKKLQVEVGGNATPFTEYFPNTNVIELKINPDEMRKRTFNAAYHEGATNFDVKCTEFSSLLYGDPINNVTAPNDFESFLFFTDPHLLEFSGWEQRCYEYIAQIQKYYNSTPTTFCLCGGDWIGNSDTPDVACYKLGYIDGFMHSMFDNCYMLVGNHDTNYQGKKDSESATYTTRLSVQSIIDLWYRNYKKSYFAFDGASTRFYCLDTGTETQELTDFDGYGWEQCEWFAEKLLTDNSQHIAIAVHVLYTSTSYTTLGKIVEEALLIAQAYNQRTTLNVNGTTYDYASATGKIEFCIAGHTHADANFVINGIPCVVTANVRNNQSLGATFDLVLVDYGAQKINLVRVGSGQNREISLS